MSLGFKRVMSSIMAFVMMVSTLVMVNVASVSAADTVLDFSSPSVVNILDPDGNGKIDAKDTYVVDSFTLYTNGENRTLQDGYFTIGSSSDYIEFTTTTAGAKVSLKLEVTTTSNRTISVTGDGSVSPENYTINSKTDPDIFVKDFTLGVAGTYKFFASNNKVNVYTLTVSENANASVKGIEAANTENYAGKFTFTPSTIDSSTAQSTDTITVSYAGDDYYMADTEITVADLTDGDNYTYDVSKLALTPKTYDITATGYPGMAGVFNYTASTDVAYGTEVTISYTGDDYTMEPQTINTNAIDPSYMTVGGTGADCTLTVDMRQFMTSTTIVEFKNVLNASELAKGDIITETLSNDKYFKFIADSTNKLTVDGNNKTFSVADGATINATQRLKTNGSGDYNKRAISFKTATDGEIYVYALAAGADGNRYLALDDGDDSTENQNGETLDSSNFIVSEFDVEAGKTYTLYSGNSGINIYYIGSTAQLVAFDDVSSDTTTTTETTTEATTTTATTTTEEPSSEESTEAPVTPADGYVAVPSTHIINKTYFGATDEEREPIIDSVKSAEGYTLNDLTFKNVGEADLDSYIRITNNTTITFKVNTKATVEITFGNNNLAISDGNDSAVFDRHDATVVKVNLYPDVTYTISGATSGNTTLSKLDFTEGNTGTDIGDIGSSETTTEGNTETTTENQPEEPENNVDISVGMTGNTGDVKVTINGTSYTFTADETKTISVPEGEKVQFKFDDDDAKYITGWTGIDPDSYDSSTQAYFTTTDAAAEGVSISLTYDPNAPTSSINEGFMTVEPDSTNVLEYGNYGYGQTKGTGIGAVKAEGVATLNSVSGVVTLYDYMVGYGSTDERLILNDAASVTFKTEGPGYLILDCSLGTPYVTIGGDEATPTKIGTTGKQGYTITAANMEVVITKPSNATRSLHLKSVRYQNEGNVITVIEAADADYTTVVNSLPEEMQTEFGTVPEGKVFAKVVAELDQATADAETVDAIGVLIIDKATADGEITNEAKVFIPRNYINDSNDSNNIIDLREDEVLYDGIYDETVPADPEGEYTLDSSTGYSDGVYYMLRYIAVAQGDYYVLPYTVIDGNAAFDEGQFTNVAALEKYAVTFGGVQ